MKDPASAMDVYEFGPFRLDPVGHALLRGAARLPLSSKSVDTLIALVEQAGAPVDKESLLARVWPGVAVEENSLAKAISEIRRTLGDESHAPRFIATIPGHGYRFVARVARVGAVEPPRRVAVMPFAILNAAVDDAYLGLGLADALIGRLSRVHQVIVRPTRAVLGFVHGHDDAVAAGRRLDVDSVVDGTIRRTDDRVRVTVQLIDVSTGTVAWADTFDETVRALFALEDVMAERIVSALAVALTGEDRRALTKQHTTSPEAYTWHLKGRVQLASRTAEDCERALDAFHHAIDADPQDALAHAGIANAYVLLGVQALVMRGRHPQDVFPRAKTAVAKALAIDGSLAEAFAMAAQVSLLYDWDSASAEQAHLRSLALDPHNPSSHHAYAMTLMFLGRYDEAFRHMTRARELDRHSPIINTNLGRLLSHTQQYERALAQFQDTLQDHPEFIVARYRLGLTLEAMGRFDDAIHELQLARRQSHDAPAPTAALACALAEKGQRRGAEAMLETLVATAEHDYVAAPCIADVWLALGDLDRTFDWFDRGVTERSSMLVTLLVNPRYDALRDDDRFQRLVQRVGLWRSGT
jgi:DNA-binding winged helix-turn-helix (wHTH) protein/tetratricopeptide (TPR) repeat protein